MNVGLADTSALASDLELPAWCVGVMVGAISNGNSTMYPIFHSCGVLMLIKCNIFLMIIISCEMLGICSTIDSVTLFQLTFPLMGQRGEIASYKR